MTHKTLRTVTDRFNIFKNSRKLSGNKRNYVLTAVRNLFESPYTQESIKLGDLFGYYGHGRREISGQLNVPEVSVIVVEGKGVVVENVPSNRTVDVSITDDGTVTHTQEILVTEPGKIVASLIDSKAGGWSWAMGGAEGRRVVPRAFAGFDYACTPNYVSLDHPSYLFESGTSREQQRSLLLESLQKQGYSASAAKSISEHFDAMQDMSVDVVDIQEDVMLLEGLLVESNLKIESLESLKNELTTTINDLEAKKALRRKLLLESVQKLPVNLSNEQIDALVDMSTEEDVGIVSALFEGVVKQNFGSLPLNNNSHEISRVSINKREDIHNNTIITFSGQNTPLYR
ncbi:head processing protein [Escherichia coli]|nr:head processing protein [Escherichia coli]